VESLLRIGLSNALAATVLAVVVAVVAVACRRKPALVHGLWMLVLLKLITPPLATFEVAWPETQSGQSISPDAPMRGAPFPVVGAVVPPDSAPEPIPPDDTESAAEMPENTALAQPTPTPTLDRGPLERVVAPPLPPTVTPALGFWASVLEALCWLDWRPVVLSAWLSGSVLWAGLALKRIARFGELLREAIPAPSKVQERVDQLSGRMGILRSPRVWLVPGAISPLLWALGTTPRLLVPETLWSRLEDDQRDALLLHELAHLRRRDHWVRLLELVIGALFWWHPVTWWARRALREAEEQCCDAWVVRALPDSPRSYATALVEAVEFLSEARAVVPIGASGLGQFRHLSRRIAMIMKGNTPPALSWVGLLAMLVLAAVLLPWLPSIAKQAPAATPTTLVVGVDEAPMLDILPPIDIEDAPADDPDREDQLADARDQIELLSIQLGSKQAAVKAAEAQIERDKRNLARIQSLFKTGAISSEEVDRIQADAQSSESQLLARQAELQEAVVKLRIAKRKLDRLEHPQAQGRGAQPGGGAPGGLGGYQGMSGAGGPIPSPTRNASESAADEANTNNLKQIGLALHSYHDTFGAFPAAAIMGKDGKPLLSWRVAILPYIEQDALFNQFRLDEAWDSPHNKALLLQIPKVFQKVGSESRIPATYFQGIIGPHAAFHGDAGLPFPQFTDGTSNTIIVAEAARPVPWTKPEDLSFKYSMDKPLEAMSELPALADDPIVLFGDGSVRRLRKLTAPFLGALLTRDGGEVVSSDQFEGGNASQSQKAGMSAGGMMAGMKQSGNRGKSTRKNQPGMMGMMDTAPSDAKRGMMMGGMPGMGGPPGVPGTAAGYGQGGMMSPPAMSGGGSMMGTAQRRDPERRLADLEAKMEQILKELETLRKERQAGPQSSRGSGR
jgi:beta-lactamase regulating signal transducer with metallopeptidase domain